MDKKHQNKRNVWDFEKNLAITNPRVWTNEAINLKYSSKVLLSYDDEVRECVFDKKTKPRFPVFWTARIIRMLFCYSLENLVKCILVQNDPDKYFKKDGSITFGKIGHDLVKLFSEAGIETNEEEKRYLEIWSKCAVYAGKYPIAKNENQFPDQRIPLPLEELVKREIIEFQKQIAEDKQLLPNVHDTLHRDVGSLEEKTFDIVFDQLVKIINKK